MDFGPITQMMIYHCEPGVDLKNVSSSLNLVAQKFVRLTKIVASQKGYRRQFWGHQVESPGLFVWSIDWESIEDHIVFMGSKGYVEVEGGLGQLFDLDAATPVTLLINIHQHESATKAFRSGVTEVAFFSFPSRPQREMRDAINEGSVESMREVETIGHATGSTIGWVFDADPRTLVEGEHSVSLFGVFGYASIDAHMAWRATPEGRRAGEEARQGSTKPATPIPGVDGETGYFHVHFQEG